MSDKVAIVGRMDREAEHAIEVLCALQVAEARTPTTAYPLANDASVRDALQMAIEALRRGRRPDVRVDLVIDTSKYGLNDLDRLFRQVRQLANEGA